MADLHIDVAEQLLDATNRLKQTLALCHAYPAKMAIDLDLHSWQVLRREVLRSLADSDAYIYGGEPSRANTQVFEFNGVSFRLSQERR